MHNFRVARLGATAAAVYAALSVGAIMLAPDITERPTAPDPEAAAPSPRPELAEAAKPPKAERQLNEVDVDTVALLAGRPTPSSAYHEALAYAPEPEDVSADDEPLAVAGDSVIDSAEDETASLSTTQPDADATLGEFSGEAGPSIPLPPRRPQAETAADEAAPGIAAQLVSLKNAPVPPARPGADELPWLRRPVVDSDTARRTAAVLSDLFANRFDEALAGQAGLDDPIAKTLVEFLYVRDGSTRASWRRIRAFMEEHPEWPSRDLIESRLEVALFSQKAPADEVLAVFAEDPPETNPGRIAMAQALLAKGQKDKAKAIASALWRRTDLTSGEERLVLERLGGLLTKPDHRARAVRLIYTGELRDASDLAGRLDDPDKKLIRAVAKALQGSKNAEKELDALPKAVRDQPVALFAKARLARRAGKDEEAGEILMKVPADEDALAVPDEWWLEQKLASRWLLERGRAKEAYELTLKHDAQSPVERSDAEWQAGWIALRFLDDPDAAIGHFTEARSVVSLPISVSRCEYWLGRAYEARGDTVRAREHYETAGQHYSTYYGQLALARLGHETMAQADKPLYAHAALRWAQSREPMKAIRLLMQIGHQDVAAQLMVSLARETESSAMQVALGELAHMLGLHTTALTIGKLGTYNGAPTEFYSFTTDGLPAYPVIGNPVDPALVYAIARQESVFNPKAMSHAGARGLMQLMPATARMTARSHGQAFHESKLIQDPTYNVMIGAAHLGELMDKYGYHAFVFAAYNAGGGRIPEWIERFGDPRTGEVDPVDWVELIPYAETRNYVQRVMEGLEVYRARFGNGSLRIAEDLGIRTTEFVENAPFETASQAPADSGQSQ